MLESSDATCPASIGVRMQWDVKVPMRDGMRLNATLYLPELLPAPSPAIFTLTPYIAQSQHDRAMYFAAQGYPFLAIDARGRGNSDGEFWPFLDEGRDGFDIVEWLAGQPYCNGKVAMCGGSYMAHNQWTTAKERPPHLVTIVPVSAVYLGVDFPTRGNVAWPYILQWLSLVSGRTAQEKLFLDEKFWATKFRLLFESGRPFQDLDELVGNPSPIFREWIAHPSRDAYWDSYNPSAADYAATSLPILTVTGSYDNAQWGALSHYRDHLKNASAAARENHYLVIGPWDHASTSTPKTEFAGIKLGLASLLDLRKLYTDWYAWTMLGAIKPHFLHKRVAYYVMGAGAEKWRYSDTLDEVTERYEIMYLDSGGSASQMFASGMLNSERGSGSHDLYRYDPGDVSDARVEASSPQPLCMRPTFPTDNVTDERRSYRREGKQLYYVSTPFRVRTEISGFFKLAVWLAIDQPDTDFDVRIYEITSEGNGILLTADSMRARHRESVREESLIQTTDPLLYEFERFTFISRVVAEGSRLRLVIGPVDSIYYQKNYNSGGVVAEESLKDARPVSVKLFHDAAHPSALHVPIAHPEL